MYRLFSTPGWFNGWDIVIESFGFIVALFIALFSWRIYRLHKENRFAYFSLAFILVALGLLVKAGTSSILYFTPVRDVAADVLRPVAGAGLKFSYLWYRSGFLLHMIPMLGAWLLLFFISQKSRARLHKFHEVTQMALFIYLILLISIVANFKYFVFYLTSSVLLALIVLNYYKHALNLPKKTNSLLVMLAFLLILLGNLFFVFVFLQNGLYVIGELFQLVGFLLLLYVYSTVIRR